MAVDGVLATGSFINPATPNPAATAWANSGTVAQPDITAFGGGDHATIGVDSYSPSSATGAGTYGSSGAVPSGVSENAAVASSSTGGAEAAPTPTATSGGTVQAAVSGSGVASVEAGAGAAAGAATAAVATVAVGA